jgi:hypothetical protein
MTKDTLRESWRRRNRFWLVPSSCLDQNKEVRRSHSLIQSLNPNQGHNSFLPHPFQFIIQYLSYHSRSIFGVADKVFIYTKSKQKIRQKNTWEKRNTTIKQGEKKLGKGRGRKKWKRDAKAKKARLYWREGKLRKRIKNKQMKKRMRR